MDSTDTGNSDYSYKAVSHDCLDLLLEQSYKLLDTTGQFSNVIINPSDACHRACKVKRRGNINLRQFRPLSAPSIPGRPDIPCDLTVVGRKIDPLSSAAGKCAFCCRRAEVGGRDVVHCRRSAGAGFIGRLPKTMSTTRGFDDSCGCSSSRSAAKRLYSSAVTSSTQLPVDIGHNNYVSVSGCHRENSKRNIIPEKDCSISSTSIQMLMKSLTDADKICDSTKTENKSNSSNFVPPDLPKPSLRLTLQKFDDIRRESQAAKERIYGRFETKARLRVDCSRKSFHTTSTTENGSDVIDGNREGSNVVFTSSNNRQSRHSKTALLLDATAKPEVVTRDRERRHPNALTSMVRSGPKWEPRPGRRHNCERQRISLANEVDFVKCGEASDLSVSGEDSQNEATLQANFAKNIDQAVLSDSGCKSQDVKRCISTGNSSLLNFCGLPSSSNGLSVSELLDKFDLIRLAGLKARQQNCHDYQLQKSRRVGSKHAAVSSSNQPNGSID